VESPHAHATVTLHDRRAAALLVDLAAPVTARELAGALPLEVVCALLDLFLEASLIGDESVALGHWEPHDLWFHARSRRGRDAGPYGASKRDDPPPVVPSFDAPTLPLDRPDIDRLRAHDLSFTDVVESRRSIRKFGAQPMTRRDLGELLFRAARIRARRGEHLSDRPYPGGGACYELEIYPVVRQCAGLEPGLYHYDAEQHGLHVLGDPSILMEEAALSAGAEQAQVLLVLSARFQRVSCKYAAMGYALTLKNAGVLMHAIALVAQAMGLGACPLGGGDAALFARVARTDPLVETSVAEILVGSR